jgi:small-conductance mechanosensitive channel
VGLAFQGTLSNFATGVMLLTFRPFKVEDYIVVAGSQGSVNEIGLFTTSVTTLDNREIIIPNSAVFGAQIENESYVVDKENSAAFLVQQVEVPSIESSPQESSIAVS